MYHPDTNSANNGDCHKKQFTKKNKDSKLKLNNMEDIFIQALITRSKTQDGLIDLLMLRADGYLPEDEIDI